MVFIIILIMLVGQEITNGLTPTLFKRYTIKWANKQFGKEYASQIGYLINEYTKYNGRIKPELLNENTYSIVNYNEYSRVVNNYNLLVDQANFIYNKIPEDQKDAFYQLVLHPILAS